MNTIAIRLLTITTGLALAGLVGLTLLFVVTRTAEASSQQRTGRALELVDAIGRLRLSLSEEQAGIYGTLMSMSPAAAEPYEAARQRGIVMLVTIDGLVSDMPGAQAILPTVRDGIGTWQRQYVDQVALAVSRNEASYHRSAPGLESGERLFMKVQGDIDRLTVAAAQEQAAAAAAAERLTTDHAWIFLGTASVLFALSVLAAVALQRLVARPIAALADVAEQVQAGRDVAFPGHGHDEIGRLARALESMRVGLMSAGAVAETARADERQRSRERKTLNDFTELLRYLDDEDAVVQATASALETSLAPDALVIHLANASRDRATVALVRGDAAADHLPLHMLDRCPGARRGSPFLIPDVELPLAVPCPAHGATVGTVACLPLTSGRELIGSVHAMWSTRTSPIDTTWRMAERICGQTALTLANRRLVQRLEVSANTDARTRLPNSRAFDLSAERVLEGRGNDPVAILMLDLDHFKNLNDRYGHPAGDEALRAFAEILRGSLRSGDVPARYGGEEFAVLLPGADLDTAMIVAERIRTKLAAGPLTLAPGITAPLTVSIGVAVAPQHGSERVQLLAAADRALYAAKEGGRNRVVGDLLTLVA